jgi:hypothetical protein
MRGSERAEVYWSDDKGNSPYYVDLPARKLPHVYGLHVAAEVCARVRTQTLLEGLYGATGSLVVHVDTDGVILSDTGRVSNMGDNFGQWREKEVMNQLEVRAPQLYRFTRPDEPYRWNYVASGQTHDQAAAIFSRSNELSTKISYLSGGDHCLPSGSSRDREELADYLAQLQRIAV